MFRYNRMGIHDPDRSWTELDLRLIFDGLFAVFDDCFFNGLNGLNVLNFNLILLDLNF